MFRVEKAGEFYRKLKSLIRGERPPPLQAAAALMEHDQHRFRSFTRPDRNLRQRSFQRTTGHLMFVDEIILSGNVFYVIKVASLAENQTSLLANCRNSVELLNLLRLLAPPGRFGCSKCNQTELMCKCWWWCLQKVCLECVSVPLFTEAKELF